MPTKITAFQDIITTSSISQWTLVPYIHNVQIWITPGNDRVIQSMFSAIPSMPNVWNLTVRCNRPPLPSIHRVWPNVRRLRFEEPTAVDSLDNLGKLIVGFTTLESLHLHGKHRYDHNDSNHWGPSFKANWQMYIPHRARRIEFRDFRSELSGAILHRHKDIEHLIIHDLLPTSLNIMQQSINDCGRSLLELVMNAGCTNLWPRRLTLTRAMYLQKLTLWSGTPMEPLLNSYTQFLHTLNSRHLVFLYIHLAENLTKTERNLILLDSIIPQSVARFCLDIIDTHGLKQLVSEWDGRELWVRLRFSHVRFKGDFHGNM
ncbi:hypothetical protein DL96DRAFT_1682678 [Flagelloscypha sp. PMI_526]|nr:hypothetical protein DL96DRAFT_1682678 [Flagelloscypha sp. PMI_526]